jgi:hypothetical protein
VIQNKGRSCVSALQSIMISGYTVTLNVDVNLKH